MALGVLSTLRKLHAAQITSAAYGLLMQACSENGRSLVGLELFELMRLDWRTSEKDALRPTAFVYR